MSSPQFSLLFSLKAKKQLKTLAPSWQKQYYKAFQLLAIQGPQYRSLRTHYYRLKDRKVWGSSASMFLRFYWDYAEKATILILFLSNH
ncbi:MAG: hypothetical protein WA865_06655 [Spirulinaceae cyanobacterium]